MLSDESANKSVQNSTDEAKSTESDFNIRMRNLCISQYSRKDPRPSKVVRNQRSVKVLVDRRVTHILTVCDFLPPRFPQVSFTQDFQYKVIEISDEPSAELSLHFAECLDFIHTGIQQGGTVLIHCFAGVSRSPAITIAYLMRYHNLPFPESLALVRSKRPWINPNFGFLAQLQRFDVWLTEQRFKMSANI